MQKIKIYPDFILNEEINRNGMKKCILCDMEFEFNGEHKICFECYIYRETIHEVSPKKKRHWFRPFSWFC